jgi:O-antigen/teichoic acid export membrane protein
MNSKRDSLAKNAFLILLNDGFNTVGPILFIVLAARILGIRKFGELSYAIALSSMFAIIADFGLSRLVTMMTARSNNHSEVFWVGMISRLLLVLLFIPVSLIGFVLIGLSREIFITSTILVLSEAFRSISIHYQSFFRGLEKMGWDFRANAWDGSIQSILGIALLLLGFGIVTISFSYLASRAVRLAFNTMVAHRNIKLRFYRQNMAKPLEYIRRSLPYGLSGMLDLAFTQGPAILLMGLSGPAAVGLFQAAFKITNAVALLQNPLRGVLFPRMSATVFEDLENARATFKMFCRYSVVVGLLATSPLIFFPEHFTFLLYGNQYASASMILLLLSIGVFIRFMAIVPMSLLSAREEQWPVTAATSISVLIFFGLGAVLTKLYSGHGMAIAWLFGSVVLFTLFSALSARRGYVVEISLIFVKLAPIAGTLVLVAMAFGCFYSSEGSALIYLIVEVLISLLCVFVMLLAFRFLAPSELRKTLVEGTKMIKIRLQTIRV